MTESLPSLVDEARESRSQPTPLGTLSCLPLEIRRKLWQLLLSQEPNNPSPLRRSDNPDKVLNWYGVTRRDKPSLEVLRLNSYLNEEIFKELFSTRVFYLGIARYEPYVIVDNLELVVQPFDFPVYENMSWERFRGIKINISMDRPSCKFSRHDPSDLSVGLWEKRDLEGWVVLTYYRHMREIVRELQKAPRLQHLEIELSSELMEIWGLPREDDVISPHIIDDATKCRISYIDLILSPLRILTNVKNVTLTGIDQDDFLRYRRKWVSDFPRPLEEMMTLQGGALSPNEKDSLESHIKPLDMLMDLALDSPDAMHFRHFRHFRQLCFEDNDYRPLVEETIKTWRSLGDLFMFPARMALELRWRIREKTMGRIAHYLPCVYGPLLPYGLPRAFWVYREPATCTQIVLEAEHDACLLDWWADTYGAGDPLAYIDDVAELDRLNDEQDRAGQSRRTESGYHGFP